MLLLALAAAFPARTQARAYSDSELRSSETSEESQIRALRDQEVAQLRTLLGRRLPTNRRADLYFRLAELYVEAYRAGYMLESRVHEKRLARGEDDRFTDHAHSSPYLKLAIGACQELLKLRIPYSKMDQVYFFLGFNYAELGNRKESLKYYDQLVRAYPGSVFAGEAYREMADAAFDKGEFRAAQAQYEAAERKGAADTLPRIQHRLAWTYYRTKQFDRAVTKMKEAIANATKSGEKLLNLREEGLRDLAIFMTETGKVEEAIEYFQETANDKNFYAKTLERLGKQYERNVEPRKASQVYESLLKTNPESDASFRVLVKLIDLDLRRGLHKEALKRLQGARIPKGGDTETQLAVQNLKAMIRRTATEHHEAFRKKGARGGLGTAEDFYEAYISSFLAKEDTRNEMPEIQMYLAEVKRELGKPKEASAIYRKVVDSRDKRYAKEAGAMWTASLAEAIKSAAQANPRKGAADPSDLEKEFVDAADQLQEVLGDTNEGREAALRSAQVLAGYKNTQDDAVKRIKKILKRTPKSPQAVTAARLWVQIHSDGGVDAVGDLRDAMEDIRENKELIAFDQQNGGKLKAMLGEQDTQLRIGAIAKEEKEKDFAAAAKGYEALAAETQERELAEKAYANAVGSYLKESDVENAVRVSEAWLKRFPKAPKAIDSLRTAATQFLIQGKFELAGSLFEKLGRDASDADSLETAARIHEGGGDSARAQKVWSSYLSLFPKSPARWRIEMSLAASHISSGAPAEAVKIYQRCMAGFVDGAAECGIRLAEIHRRAGEKAHEKSALNKVAAMKKGASSYVGYARFLLAEAMETSAKFDPLQLPEAQLKKAMGQRLNFLEPLSRAYSSAVEAGGPWAVAALDRLARWAYGFADEVDRIPPPAGADAKAIAAFKKSLAEISGPLRKKAIATWTDAYSKALAAEALSPALPELADQMADARHPSPARAQGFRGRFRLAGISSESGQQELEKTRERLSKNPQDASAWIDYGNLLWGAQRPLLARLAYDRAASLTPKSSAVHNNRAVILLAGGGEEDWIKANEASELLKAAIASEGGFLPARLNRAALLNYFRLFSKARPLWEQVLAKSPAPDAHDGLGISFQGLGSDASAEAQFKKARDAGADASRFAEAFHKAARLSRKTPEECLSAIEDMKAGDLSGFEKDSVERLKRTCEKWKDAK